MQRHASVDEAAAELKMQVTTKPIELDALDREILQLEMEKISLARDEGGEKATLQQPPAPLASPSCPQHPKRRSTPATLGQDGP